MFGELRKLQRNEAIRIIFFVPHPYIGGVWTMQAESNRDSKEELD